MTLGTRHPRPGAGLHFGGKRALALADKLSLLRAENARRMPCPGCGLRILPENMERHEELHAPVE
jgi:hypothetical protein